MKFPRRKDFIENLLHFAEPMNELKIFECGELTWFDRLNHLCKLRVFDIRCTYLDLFNWSGDLIYVHKYLLEMDERLLLR